MKKYTYTGILTLLVLGIAVTTHASTTLLKPGLFNNKEVMILQKKLGVTPTGNYLTQTTAAVKQIQSTNNLPATGIVDSSTQKVIDLIETKTILPPVLPKITPDVTKTLPTDLTTPTGFDKWTALCMDSKPHVQVLSPNGGESYVAGQQVNVKWRSCNVPTVYGIILDLHKNSFPVESSFGLMPVVAPVGSSNIMVNDGQEVITIPNAPLYGYSNFQYGTDFKINLWSQDFTIGANNVNNPLFDQSDNFFTVNAPETLTTQTTNQVFKNGTAPVAQAEKKTRQACTQNSSPFIETLPMAKNTYYHGEITTVKVRTCNLPGDKPFSIDLFDLTKMSTYPNGIPIISSIEFGGAPSSVYNSYRGSPGGPEGYFEFSFKIPPTLGPLALNGTSIYSMGTKTLNPNSPGLFLGNKAAAVSILPPPSTNPTQTAPGSVLLQSSM